MFGEVSKQLSERVTRLQSCNSESIVNHIFENRYSMQNIKQVQKYKVMCIVAVKGTLDIPLYV